MPAAQISSISSLERGWRSMLAILCTSVMDFRSHPRIGITTYSEWSTVIRFEQWELLARAAVCPSQRHTRLLLVVTYLICAVVLIQVGPPREPALPDGASIRAASANLSPQAHTWIGTDESACGTPLGDSDLNCRIAPGHGSIRSNPGLACSCSSIY